MNAGTPPPNPNNDLRGVALQELAGLLRGQGYTVQVESWHLTVTADGGRSVEVWAQTRPDDDGRLWFTWAGGIPVCEADRPVDTVVAVKAALRRVPLKDPAPV